MARAPTRSDAAAAAAGAVTRAGRVKQVSQAALRAVESENHEAQQARRSGATNKSARRAGTNRQGQTLASGTPKVIVSSQITRRGSTPHRRTLAPLNAPASQQRPSSRSTTTPLHITALQNSTSAATSATVVSTRRSDSLDFYLNATAQPRSQTATSLRAPRDRNNEPIETDAEDAMDLEPHPSLQRTEPIRANDLPGTNSGFPASDNEGMDVEPAGGGPEGEAEDWDEGASDDFVPSDIGDAEDQEAHEDDEGDDDHIGEGHGDEPEDAGEEGPGVKIKSRARRNSRKMKKHQPKASDYDEDIEALLNYGLGFMRAMVISEKPMPSVDESIELAADAFELAKHDRPTVRPPPDIKYIAILRRAIPQVRGKVKDAARARTGDSYGFDDRPRMEPKNRRRYLTLVEQDAYTYEKPESLEGPYYHPLCYKILKTCFFSKPGDDGVAFSEFFSPIRPETIALVFTAIRMCLDEWKSGSYKPLTFTSDTYDPVYQVHLANLKALGEEDPLFVEGLGRELWEDCSEPFDLDKKSKPTVSISAAQKTRGVQYGLERRNARAAQKVSAATAAAAATAATAEM